MKKDIYDLYTIDDEMDEMDEQVRYDHVPSDDTDDEEETEFEALDDLCKEQVEVKNKKKTTVLTEESILEDLTKKYEADRNVYTFSKGDATYRGYVLAKFDNESYIFNVEDLDSSFGKRMKKFKIADIEERI